MPIKLYNDYLGTKSEPFTWRDILTRRQAGFSIVKTPHIGNQHPSNLLCAALGIHMDMVTFTSGEKDKNFHPHMRIEAGQQRKLYESATYTPFATVYNGESSEDYHQSAVRRVFPGTFITTDAQLIMSESTLAEKVFRRASMVTRDLWYRKVSADGRVERLRVEPRFDTIAPNIFRFTSEREGYVIPNRLQIIYTFVWQALGTGRDTIFSLSGPNMVSYIGGLQTSLSYMYDAIRVELPELPETLAVYVVPVAQSRFLTHVDRRDSLDAVLDVISWYERQAPEAKARAQTELLRVSVEYPEFTRGIEYGDFMSQYDLKSPEDLYIPKWLLSVPLGRLRKFYDTMATATAARSAA